MSSLLVWPKGVTMRGDNCINIFFVIVFSPVYIRLKRQFEKGIFILFSLSISYWHRSQHLYRSVDFFNWCKKYYIETKNMFWILTFLQNKSKDGNSHQCFYNDLDLIQKGSFIPSFIISLSLNNNFLSPRTEIEVTYVEDFLYLKKNLVLLSSFVKCYLKHCSRRFGSSQTWEVQIHHSSTHLFTHSHTHKQTNELSIPIKKKNCFSNFSLQWRWSLKIGKTKQVSGSFKTKETKNKKDKKNGEIWNVQLTLEGW